MKTTVLFAVMILVLLVGCVFVPPAEIDTTYIDEELFPPSDEFLIVPMEELPFRVEIPSGWGFSENAAEYILWVDEGATGSIVFAKKPLGKTLNEVAPDGTMVMQNAAGDVFIYCDGNSCAVQGESLDELYGFVISDKGFSTQQNSEVWEIVKSLQLD